MTHYLDLFALRASTLAIPYDVRLADGTTERRAVDLDLTHASEDLALFALSLCAGRARDKGVPVLDAPPAHPSSVLWAYWWQRPEGLVQQPGQPPGPVDEAYCQDRRAWIRAHGSARLRLAAEGGYEHDGIYIEERGAIEYAGLDIFIDRSGTVSWVDRRNPSAAALELERMTQLALGAREATAHLAALIVQPTVRFTLFPFREAESSETLLIRGWLGRFNVFARIAPYGGGDGTVW